MSIAFTLHGSPHSLPTYRVALMLRLCGVAFRFRYVSFQRGMHRSPEFRALSRWGQVPVLEHDGRVLVQSAALLEYLSDALDRFGAADVETGLVIREWLFWDADRLMPPLYGWYSVALGRRNLLPLYFEPAVIARWQALGEAALSALDDTVSGHYYLVGSTPTIADICCYASVAFARLSGSDLALYSHVAAWAARIEALPGFAPPLDLLPMQDAVIVP